MLQLINISLSFGGQELFRGLNWHLRKGDRVGLVGPNGAGKTTLFRLITGQLEPDAGTIQRGRAVTLGYLPQEGIEVAGRSLFAEAMTNYWPAMAISNIASRSWGGFALTPRSQKCSPV